MIKLYVYLTNSHPGVTEPTVHVTSREMDHVWMRIGEFMLNEEGMYPRITNDMAEAAHQYEIHKEQKKYLAMASRVGAS